MGYAQLPLQLLLGLLSRLTSERSIGINLKEVVGQQCQDHMPQDRHLARRMKPINGPTLTLELAIAFLDLRTDLIQLDELLGRQAQIGRGKTEIVDFAGFGVGFADHTDIHRHA